MPSNFPELEDRYIAVKLSDMNKEQSDALVKLMHNEEIYTRNVVVIEKGKPGYDVACGIAIHGRICRRLSACTCTTQEQREPCFDWVKV